MIFPFMLKISSNIFEFIHADSSLEGTKSISLISKVYKLQKIIYVILIFT